MMASEMLYSCLNSKRISAPEKKKGSNMLSYKITFKKIYYLWKDLFPQHYQTVVHTVHKTKAKINKRGTSTINIIHEFSPLRKSNRIFPFNHIYN